MLQRSARHLVPLVGTIAEVLSEVWDLDLDGYDTEGIDLVHRTALDVRRALRLVEASDILVTKVMLGVFGCVPAFDTYFRRVSGFPPSARDRYVCWERSIEQTHRSLIDCGPPTLGFATGQPTTRLYTRAKVVDMIFFIEGGYPSRARRRRSPLRWTRAR